MDSGDEELLRVAGPSPVIIGLLYDTTTNRTNRTIWRSSIAWSLLQMNSFRALGRYLFAQTYAFSSKTPVLTASFELVVLPFFSTAVMIASAAAGAVTATGDRWTGTGSLSLEGLLVGEVEVISPLDPPSSPRVEDWEI